MRIDRVITTNQCARRSSAYFDEDQNFRIQTDDIQLIFLIAPVTGDHLKAKRALEVVCRKVFSILAALATSAIQSQFFRPPIKQLTYFIKNTQRLR